MSGSSRRRTHHLWVLPVYCGLDRGSEQALTGHSEVEGNA